MTKRKNMLVVIITLLLICIFLTACGDGGNHESAYLDDDDNNSQTEVENHVDKDAVKPLVYLGKFKIEGTNVTQYIFYDPDNLVMYSYFSNTNDRGPEPMVNPDGTYKIYDPETWVR